MKDNKSKSIQFVPTRKFSPGHFSDVIPSLFPSPTAKIKTAFHDSLEWNKVQNTECGPRIVFFSSDPFSDSSALVLPSLIASAGVTVPTVLIPPLYFWNRMSSLTGMNLKLSPHEFSHLLVLGQIAICRFAVDIEKLREKKSKATSDFIRSYLQTVFFFLCQSSPHYAVFNIRIGGEKNLQTMEQGFELADKFQKLCSHLFIKSTYILTDFHQPAGESLGEFLTLREGLMLLNGSGPRELLKLILELGTVGLKMIFPQTHPTEIKTFLKNLLISGKAKEKAREMIVRQGGSPRLFDNLASESGNLWRTAVPSPRFGYVQEISWTKALALQHKLEGQHPDSGITFFKKPGDFVAMEESLGEILLPGDKMRSHLKRDFLGLFSISAEPVAYRPLILGRP